MRNISILITEQQLQDVINQIISKQFSFGDEDIDNKSGVEVGTDAGDTEDISTLKISEMIAKLIELITPPKIPVTILAIIKN